MRLDRADTKTIGITSLPDVIRQRSDGGGPGSDLHDRTVRRLYMASVAIHAVSSMVGEEPAGRLRDALDELDLAIREIQTSAFRALQPDAGWRRPAEIDIRLGAQASPGAAW